MIVKEADQRQIASIFFLNEPSSSGKLSQYFAWNESSFSIESIRFHYILDHNQHLKWIFPAKARYPTFLRLDNRPFSFPLWKRRLIRLGFILGVKKWIVSGSFFVKKSTHIPLLNLLNTVPHENFSILVYSSEKSQKSVVALSQNRFITHFIKIAHTDRATELINNEIYALQILSQRRLKKIVHPFLSHTEGDHTIIVSSVIPSKKDKSRFELTPLHIKAMAEMYSLYHHKCQLRDLTYYRNLNSYISAIKSYLSESDQFLAPDIKSQLAACMQAYEKLFQRVNLYEEIEVSLSHGDFIPWNMYMTSSQVFLYDWEYAQESCPLLYDLFYFVIHSSINNPPQKTSDTLQHINELLVSQELQHICKAYGIDPWHYYRLFLFVEVPFAIQVHIRSDGSEAPKLLIRVLAIFHDLLSTVNAYERLGQ